jgi:putative Holliday junction resolvase
MSSSLLAIAIDYGTHKSGLAYSVEGFCFAHKTVATSELFTILPEWIREKKAEKVIIGMPYNIDGSESSHSKKVRKFAKELEKNIEKEIVFHDERLTTSEARLG